ncbi:hypothetical protein LZG04_19670 [Saccharothrix sp. S26]|uniref:hypothetical protein n=1 Tax=Saccharothrix sp. S26 TaxID=2907215 RepID=UPI001F4591B5|nr:hypothetical protein [Saccharothrix sp. S26]MCE6997005.1 hypothetical protein [Saccharothrix sp. S26]
MSWQEDLAELDRNLAEGRISADDYRRRRDELLSAASGPGTPAQPNSGPFAAPFRWDAAPAANPAPPSADATQVVNTGKPPVNPDADRTQYVRPVTPPPHTPPPHTPPPGNQLPPQVPGWQSGPPTTTPPWGGGDGFGPVMDPNPGWLAQGPEVFEEKSGGGKRVLAIVGAVVVLALIGGGIWFFTKDGSDPNQQGGGTVAAPTSETTTTTTKPKDSLSIIEMPGTVEDHSNITTFADAMKSNFLTAEEIAHYTTAGAGKARLAASRTSEGVHVLIFTAEATSPAAADTGRDSLHQQQLTYGMQEYPKSPKGVQSGQVEKNGQTPATIRGHYSAKSTIIRIQVNGDDLVKVASVYDDVLAEQLEVLAPNE